MLLFNAGQNSIKFYRHIEILCFNCVFEFKKMGNVEKNYENILTFLSVSFIIHIDTD